MKQKRLSVCTMTLLSREQHQPSQVLATYNPNRQVWKADRPHCSRPRMGPSCVQNAQKMSGKRSLDLGPLKTHAYLQGRSRKGRDEEHFRSEKDNPGRRPKQCNALAACNPLTIPSRLCYLRLKLTAPERKSIRRTAHRSFCNSGLCVL